MLENNSVIIKKPSVNRFILIFLLLMFLLVITEIGYYFKIKYTKTNNSASNLVKEKPDTLELEEEKPSEFNVPVEMWGSTYSAQLLKHDSDNLTVKISDGNEEKTINSEFDFFALVPLDGKKDDRVNYTIDSLLNKQVKVQIDYKDNIRSAIFYY